MEKYGFIYLWYDRKRKMYYIGCHWGTEDDGYICSSNRMRDAYRRRQTDFKRRILAKVHTNRNDLFEEEYKWLSKIKDHELGTKYYNLHKNRILHWSTATIQPDKRSIGEKISEGKKKAKEKKIQAGLPVRKPNSHTPNRGPQSEESNRKRSEAMKRAWEEGRNKGTTGKQYEWSEERKQKHLESVQGCHDSRDPSAYVLGNKKAWAEGKYVNRKSNNMRNYIWVTRKEDGTKTRIKKELFDDQKFVLGRS